MMMNKKIVAMLTTICVAIGMIYTPVSAAIDDEDDIVEVVKSGYWGTNLNWQYHYTEEDDERSPLTLQFAGRGAMDNAPSEGFNVADYGETGNNPSYRNNTGTTWRTIEELSNTKIIKLDDNITAIGDYAFQSFPKGGSTIAKTPFQDLMSVDFPASCQVIGAYAFRNSPIGKGDDGEAVDLSSTVVKTIKDGAFYNCAFLYEIAFPRTLMSIGDKAFQGDEKLESVNFSGTQLETIGENAFQGCSELDNVKLTDSNLRTMGKYAFDSTNITEIELPSTMTTIDDYVFSNCKALDTVKIPKEITTIADFAFSGSTNISTVEFYGTQEQWNSLANGRSPERIFYSEDVELEIKPNGGGGGSETGMSGVLDGGDYWEYIEDPDNTGANPTYILTFEGDSPIDDQNESGLITGEVQNYRNLGPSESPAGLTGDYRQYAKNTTKIIFDNDIPEIGDYAFYCYPSKYMLFSKLKTVVLPESLTMVGRYAFAKCTNLEEFKVTGNKLSEVDEDAFMGCRKLKTVDLGNLITNIRKEAFKNCESLEEINLPAIKEMGEEAFSGCSSLKSVTLGKSITQIPKNAFLGCTSMKSFTAPGKTEFTSYCLTNCTGLTTLTVGEDVKFDDYAFTNCNSLTDIYYAGSRLKWQAMEKGAGNEALKDPKCFVHCSDGVINDKVPAFATINSKGETTIFVGQKIDPSLIFSDLRDIQYYKTGSSKAKIIDPDAIDSDNVDENGKKKDPGIKKNKMGSNTYLVGKKKGSTSLTAYDERGNILKTCVVNILKRPKFKTFKTQTGEKKIYPGDTISANQFIKNCPEYPEMFTWESSDIDVATVSGNDGTIYAKQKGSTIISLMYGTWEVRKKKIKVKKSKTGYKIITD